VLTFVVPREENVMEFEFTPELIREMVVLKAKALGVSDSGLEEMDEMICALVGIDDPDPLIYPT
jgi:hypothetical protein